jgi:hypothetical protein
VTDGSGRRLVSRLYARQDDKVLVELPDGSLGFTSGSVTTDEPFRPWTKDQVRESLLNGPFAGFQAIEAGPYLVLYQSSQQFARRSAQLLQSLYNGLTQAFQSKGFSVREPEVPLVAVIFANERDFRAHHEIAPEVQAYYEIYSNRIFLYETSARDQAAPDIAALRKPQTVAHEGTHQILQNIGIHPRLAPWPPWLIEGLAEYCAPTSTDSKGQWARFGQVNPFHMATLIDLQNPLALQQHVQGANLPTVGRDLRSAWIEALVTRDDLTPTDYALAWAVTHYLASRQPDAFRAFLRKMGERKPLETRTPQQHLADFRAAFGTDLRKLSPRITKHLSGLKYEHLPHYAVLFEQPIGDGLARRGTLVSQSPAMIRQWLEQIRSPQGGPPQWRFLPFASPNQARAAAETWLQSR